MIIVVHKNTLLNHDMEIAKRSKIRTEVMLDSAIKVLHNARHELGYRQNRVVHLENGVVQLENYVIH